MFKNEKERCVLMHVRCDWHERGCHESSGSCFTTNHQKELTETDNDSIKKLKKIRSSMTDEFWNQPDEEQVTGQKLIQSGESVNK